jgi:flagellar basal-body rod protein FlgC
MISATFGNFAQSGSALSVYRKWMDAVSDNVANVNTARRTSESAFQARMVVAEAKDGGVGVKGIALGDPQGKLMYEPGSPLADGQGMVRYPDIDMGDQMVQMMVAQRGYQANLSVIDRARDAYLAALQIGK